MIFIHSLKGRCFDSRRARFLWVQIWIFCMTDPKSPHPTCLLITYNTQGMRKCYAVRQSFISLSQHGKARNSRMVTGQTIAIVKLLILVSTKASPDEMKFVSCSCVNICTVEAHLRYCSWISHLSVTGTLKSQK